MSIHQQQGQAKNKIEESDVVEYLRNKPEFFVSHKYLLEELKVPHSDGRTTSLVERQVSVLREKSTRLKQQLDSLIKIARDNDRLNTHLQNLTLSLMAATKLEQMLIGLNDSLTDDFNVDCWTLELFAEDRVLDLPAEYAMSVDVCFINPGNQGLKSLLDIAEKGEPVCGRLKAEQVEHLYGDCGTEISSSALIPLINKEDEDLSGCVGLLAIGSHDGDRFHPEMSTNFLAQLGQMLASKINQFI